MMPEEAAAVCVGPETGYADAAAVLKGLTPRRRRRARGGARRSRVASLCRSP